MNEEKPRELSPEERVQKSRVKEDVDIFDEVFDGKKEKHVEEIIKTIKPEKENTAFEKSSGAKAEAFEKSIGAKEKKENKSIEKEIELEENEEAEEENIEEPEEELKKELPPKNELKKLILRKALKSATKEIEEEVEEEKEERGETISEMEGAPEPEEKFVEEVPANSMPLQFLEDEKNESVFIGRKKSVFLNYGSDAALLIGRLEEEGYNKKKVFLDGLNPHVVFVCGARGSGKCLTGDSLITLEDGSVIPIKELENNDKRVLGLNHELKVVPLKKEGFYKRKVSKLLYLRLRSGREIKLTPEHPLLTINGWMQTQELKAKDRIAVPRALNVFGNTRMRECDIKLLAYFIAEGHLRNAFVLFSNEDKKILEDFSQSIKEFDENLRIEVHSKIGCYRVAQKKKPIDLTNVVRNKKGQFTSKGFIVAQKSSLAKWFESIGLYGKLTKEKVIPEEVLKLPKEQLALFLNRLFSCDGSIHPISRRKNNWQVSYSSSSDKMIRQVQNLLIRFGILSRLRFKKVKCNEKKFNSFELVISSESVIRFIQEIGFFGVKELKQENAIKDMLEVSRNPNVDTIPKEIWGIYRPKNCKAASRAMGYNPNYVHSSLTYAPSRKKLLRMAQIEGNKGVQMIAESDIFWDEVTELKEIPGEDVYDISVPEYYNFVANDIIVHNSYVLGVIAEELALKNSNVGIVVIDPIGVFWSMKYANKEEKELSALIEWGLEPQGLDNLKVFIPAGMKNETPKNTYDATFSIQPSLLTSEDWCLTFGMERFGPSGLLLDKVIKKVEHGYKTIEGKYVKANKQGFSLDGMINCLETDEELNSRERGYKQDSIRALVSRFEAAKSWGIFDEKGTPLGELSRENQLTVLDTSFLEANVTALVIGILARRILSARKLSTRRESANKMKATSMNALLETDIPPTWMFIDEAHTLIPSGNVNTPATNALVEYVKQGRRPGCSIVFATQQPSAIDTRVLSQLDILLTHKLVFDDDIKAIYKRIPTIIPHQYKKSNFIRSLPIGYALTGDRREETSRAFVMSIRPRMSQHEGRDAETISLVKSLSKEQVENLAMEIAFRELGRDGEIGMDKINQLINSLNSKYKAKAMLSSVLDLLEERKAVIEPDRVVLAEKLKEKEEVIKEAQEKAEERIKEQEEKKVERESILSFPLRLKEEEAKKIVNKVRKRKRFGLVGKEEQVKQLQLVFEPVYKISFNDFNKSKEFIATTCFINAITGEFIHVKNDEFIESRGFNKVMELDEEQLEVFAGLIKRKGMEEKLEEENYSETRIKKVLGNLTEKGLVDRVSSEGKVSYFLNREIELPPDSRHSLIDSLNELPLVELKNVSIVEANFSEEKVIKSLQKMWKTVIVKKVSLVYRPFYYVSLEENGKERKARIDAITGKVVQ